MLEYTVLMSYVVKPTQSSSHAGRIFANLQHNKKKNLTVQTVAMKDHKKGKNDEVSFLKEKTPKKNRSYDSVLPSRVQNISASRHELNSQFNNANHKLDSSAQSGGNKTLKHEQSPKIYEILELKSESVVSTESSLKVNRNDEGKEGEFSEGLWEVNTTMESKTDITVCY